MAGPYAPFQGRVDWQQRLEQGFQARYHQQLQNQNLGQQERYAEEERLHAVHLAELGRQCEEQREQERLAHLAETQ